jgi:hypothetical protein
MGSRLEKLSDDQLNKYMIYFNKLTQDIKYGDLDDFYQAIMYDDQLVNMIKAPLGIDTLDRLDIEYFYYLVKKNGDDGSYVNRPQIDIVELDYVTEEKVYIRYTRTGEIETYLSGDLDSVYLNTIKDGDEIDPWDWDVVDEDVRDSSVNDEYFNI